MSVSFADVGRWLIIAGVVVAVLGAFLLIGSRFGLGHLPGDIAGPRGSVSFAFPIVTCLLMSVVLTIVINVILRLRQ